MLLLLLLVVAAAVGLLFGSCSLFFRRCPCSLSSTHLEKYSVLRLEWCHAEPHAWKGAGLARTANGLTFLQVYDAGHMVPADQPEIALDMLHDFVTGSKF
jgi:hypothetical protein